MVKITLNSKGVKELLKSDEIKNECLRLASEVKDRAGEHYQVEVRHYRKELELQFFSRCKGHLDNMKNNTLLKALKG